MKKNVTQYVTNFFVDKCWNRCIIELNADINILIGNISILIGNIKKGGIHMPNYKDFDLDIQNKKDLDKRELDDIKNTNIKIMNSYGDFCNCWTRGQGSCANTMCGLE